LDTPWLIERLGRRHDRSGFDCGQISLNDWLQHRASQFDKRDLARSYVAHRANDTRVLGYYTLSNHRVSFQALPGDEAKGLPRIDIPVMLLGKLAVDRSAQGQGLGALLLVDALRRVVNIAEQVGIRAVEVDALDEAARQFYYLKFGFITLRDDPLHLFLPMQVVRRLGLD
jgi:GNAT superfamily N-acetyltransferase